MIRALLDPLGSSAGRAKYNRRRFASTAFAPSRELKDRQLETLLEPYFTSVITRMSLLQLDTTNSRNLTKLCPKHRTIRNDNDNARVTALWRIDAGERDTQYVSRQDGAAAGYPITMIIYL